MALSALAWGGIIGMIFLIATAVSGYLVMNGKVKMKVHQILAWILLVIALAHALYALSNYF